MLKIVVLLAVFACVCFTEGQVLLGGWSKWVTVGDDKRGQEIQAMVDKLQSAVEEEAGRTFDTLKAVSYKAQVVDGLNYVVRVSVEGGDHMNLKIFEPPFGDPVFKGFEVLLS